MLETKISSAMRVPRQSAYVPIRPRRRSPDAGLTPRSPQGSPFAGPNRLARSQAALIGAAVATAALVCALLLLYLAAYAHLWQIGVRQDHLRRQLKTLQLRNQTLQAQLGACKNPRLIASLARKAGMAPGTRLAEIITPSGAGTALAQGIEHGQTNSQRVASRDH